ncbi:DNA alkylation repair protein [bacterium]|nr:DNA alkylation repair protein [bacterium]
MDIQRSTVSERWRRELADELARVAGHDAVACAGIDTSNTYTTGGHDYYGLPVPARQQIAATWLRTHRDAAVVDVLATCDSLIGARTYEDKTLGCMILKRHESARSAVVPSFVARWLDELAGWAEADSLCQNLFPAEQLLSDWPSWKTLVEELAIDDNVNKRRAALVLLTGPVHYSPDVRLATLAFATIGTLASERAPLITKAISWLLRSLTTNHVRLVAAYLEANRRTLPALAVRETSAKLASGTKRGRLPVGGRPV